jgi:predicted homoserine dehydrogenase-like protein
MTSLSTKLAEREASGKPIQIGLIGAGKFGSMLYVIDPLDKKMESTP